jgi:thiol-disulfide isomerase/thioredoxin
MKAIIDGFRKFFDSKFNRYLALVLIIVGLLGYFYTGPGDSAVGEGLVVNFFYLPTCPHCAEQKPVIYELQEEMPEIIFIFHDASSVEGSALFYQMSLEAGLDLSTLGVPTTFVGKHPLVGVHSKEQIKGAIAECQKNCIEGENASIKTQSVETSFKDYDLPFIGRVDLTGYSIPVLAVTLGLIDGFNPCAMWVLVYLIGLLIGINDRKKMMVIIGSFVVASGVLYFLFMTAWINIFLLVGYVRPLTLLIGIVALGGGILNLKDYFTKKDALTCEVGDEKSHEKTLGRMENIVSQPLSAGIILSIVGLAFVVNSVEFVCSSAIPAVFTQILALSNLSTLQHYLYIGVYTFFFMLDDLIIFGLAAFAVSSTLGNKYAKYCKLFGGVILAVIGFMLVFTPHLLR